MAGAGDRAVSRHRAVGVSDAVWLIWPRACVLSPMCVSEALQLRGFQAPQAESTNLHLIKRGLCNITYMRLHLTPIILRKAQALLQPDGLRASGADLPGT